LFSSELQLEWVQSGQVIRLVTVSILLSVILALGLSGNLKENTLGTYPVRKAGQSMMCADARASPWHVGVVRWSAWRHRFPTWTLDRSTS